MPHFNFYGGTSSSTEWSTVLFSVVQIQQEFEEYQYQQEQEQRVWEQQWAEEQAQKQEERRLAKELREDKRKYPLFFWRETCAKRTLKEGIVWYM